ncbi:MAG TPA: phage portal protein [Solirubrobacterales bacterium]|nr:phage portal protein [Solirubrobacterales bacterium]
MPSELENLQAQIKRYCDALDKRASEAKTLDDYREGIFPLPPFVQDTGLTDAYRTLMRLSGANWPGLIVGAVEERLEVQGVRFGGKQADEDVWDLWQEAGLDAESSMLHDSVLTTGRGFAQVWGDGSADPQPVVTLEHASMCIVEYVPGTNGTLRKGALRRWTDGKKWYANLFTPRYLFKFVADSEACPTDAASWKVREDDGDEEWPLENPLGVVPIVEFAVNKSLRPSPFGTGRGEFASHLRHIDRIHYKLFSGLVALTWSGFPLRYVIGDPIVYAKKDDGTEDKSKPIPPFDSIASAVAQFSNANVKVGQLPEANVDNYSPEMDIKHLAALTKTPANYLLGELVNVSADGIRAAEAGLVSKVRRHHRPLGESWEEVTRLALRVKNPEDPRGKDQSAQIIWKAPEMRSLAEQADAAAKLGAAGLPWQGIAEIVLGLTPQEIKRYGAERGSDVLGKLLNDGAPAAASANAVSAG